MALSYDYTGKLIGVPSADAAPLTIQTLLNSIRAQEAGERGICDPAICAAAGKDDLGGSVSVGITVSLLSTWKLNFAAGAYQATVSGGNLADALNKVNNAGSAPQVLFLASAAGTLTTVSSGSGLSAGEQTKLDEIHKIHGLAIAAPLAVAAASRSAGSISQTIVDVAGIVTVTRQ